MTTVDKIEIEKFSKLAKDWWNPNSKFKPLHLFNPARISFIKDKLIAHFELNSNSEKPLQGLKILDIGCGGGLLCEPLTRLGATMTGIDASNNNIEVAKLHSKEMSLNIKYIRCSPENLNFNILEKIKKIDLIKLPEISNSTRVGSCISKPGKFIGIGLNFSDHAAETGAKIPTEPIVFMKATSCISGPYDKIVVSVNNTIVRDQEEKNKIFTIY